MKIVGREILRSRLVVDNLNVHVVTVAVNVNAVYLSVNRIVTLGEFKPDGVGGILTASDVKLKELGYEERTAKLVADVLDYRKRGAVKP